VGFSRRFDVCGHHGHGLGEPSLRNDGQVELAYALLERCMVAIRLRLLRSSGWRSDDE
jgi:hypothetical protein